ncbi:MAG TPA: CpaF family protein [Candidatus Diapherotrites archaeon]|uniref:CpaF family protein n=1 Tax=Candidatus Iainarchaeum sp. TaxID=3101447 RepID=A0A7J4IYH9_9ARCH|nr:CpaF family protein [Candidatus Diapherotrites archaeon]
MKEWKGELVAQNEFASIFEGFPFYYYEVKEPQLSQQEQKLVVSLTNAVLGKWSMEEGGPFSAEFISQFKEKVLKPVTFSEAQEYLVHVEDFEAIKLPLIAMLRDFFPLEKNQSAVAELVLSNSIGYGPLAPLIADPSLEEIMLNGYDRPVFVFHKQYAHCRTNVFPTARKNLDGLLQKIAKSVGKDFDADHPLLDARLPDGNRANATFPFVTPFGPSLTIRKFSNIPLTIVDLIANKTFTSELAAFIWVMVEGFGIEPMNIIVTGGAGSGKTSTLNAIAAFIRYPERIVSIEDTLEIQLGSRQNWVQMESRPQMKGQSGVSMDDLLKNALRMRPDRIVVGEVRGSEAQTLFAAMDTGHKGILGTLHSNSAKEMLLRLRSEPMAVPESMIPLLNIILVQYRMYVKGRGIERRVLSVTEVSSMDGKPLLGNIYEWDRKTDVIGRTDIPAALLDLLALKTMRTKKDIDREITVRKRIIEWMLRSNVRAPADVEMVIQQYYYNPDSLLQKILAE